MGKRGERWNETFPQKKKKSSTTIDLAKNVNCLDTVFCLSNWSWLLRTSKVRWGDCSVTRKDLLPSFDGEGRWSQGKCLGGWVKWALGILAGSPVFIQISLSFKACMGEAVLMRKGRLCYCCCWYYTEYSGQSQFVEIFGFILFYIYIFFFIKTHINCAPTLSIFWARIRKLYRLTVQLAGGYVLLKFSWIKVKEFSSNIYKNEY